MWHQVECWVQRQREMRQQRQREKRKLVLGAADMAVGLKDEDWRLARWKWPRWTLKWLGKRWLNGRASGG
ncbi:hypothetical protein NL676_033371 [Syzygium grande]|nr:hypothetical protein NL676_033371 [Syzygium grande]